MHRNLLLMVTAVALMSGAVACAAGGASLEERVEDGGSDAVAVGGGLVTSTPTNVRSYLGVPYAAPPVGDLRWKPPQPVGAWDGVKHADKHRTGMYTASARTTIAISRSIRGTERGLSLSQRLDDRPRG